MPQRNRSDGQASATRSKFYLPAGANPSSLTSQLEGIWATLFSHGIEKPK